jgi:hypothetical protein
MPFLLVRRIGLVDQFLDAHEVGFESPSVHDST